MYRYGRALRHKHPKEAIIVGETLLDEANSLHNLPRAERANFLLATCYYELHDFDQSIKYYLDELRIEKELKQYDRQIRTMHDMGIIYDITHDLENEKKYVIECLQICEQHKNEKEVWSQRTYLLDNLATIYKKEEKLDTAIKIYQQVIELARKADDTDQQVSSLANMAIALKSNKDYQRSLTAYNDALSLLDTVRGADGYAVILDNMAVLFYNMGDMPRSEQYALRALNLSRLMNNIDLKRDAYETLKNVYIKQKRFEEAVDYFSKWSDIKDTLFNDE